MSPLYEVFQHSSTPTSPLSLTHTHTQHNTQGCLIAQSYGQRCQCNDTLCRSNSTDRCCDWVEQPIDMNPASLDDPAGTPLGYLQEGLPGGESTDPLPCVTFTFPNGAGIRYLTVPVRVL